MLPRGPYAPRAFELVLQVDVLVPHRVQRLSEGALTFVRGPQALAVIRQDAVEPHRVSGQRFESGVPLGREPDTEAHPELLQVGGPRAGTLRTEAQVNRCARACDLDRPRAGAALSRSRLVSGHAALAGRCAS